MRLLNWYESIYEQAQRLNKYNDKLESFSDTIARHWLKCKLYPNSIHKSHWKKEIQNFVDELDIPILKVKGGKKYKTVYRHFINDAEWISMDNKCDEWINKYKKHLNRDSDERSTGTAKSEELIDFMEQIVNLLTENANNYEEQLKAL